MKRNFLLALTALLSGCATNQTEVREVRVQSTADLPHPAGLYSSTAAAPAGWDPAYKQASSANGPACQVITATKKRCVVPHFSAPHANWTTEIGVGEPHWIEIEQVAPNRVAIEFRFNIYSHDRIRAAFDPDVKFSYAFKNKDDFRVGSYEFDYWRECDGVEVHVGRQVLPSNLDFVAATDHVMMAADYRVNVHNC